MTKTTIATAEVTAALARRALCTAKRRSVLLKQSAVLSGNVSSLAPMPLSPARRPAWGGGQWPIQMLAVRHILEFVMNYAFAWRPAGHVDRFAGRRPAGALSCS